ncbi:carbohydrate kinase family protein [Virgibacillus sp. MSP4-1]|uniref:carbohydrate kinase family protein n=1 Tax=Virgibacillus sp. MSP4-1 TaxID=2700081 RepID=UPI0003A79339|nr:carbohydrate kinase family protein [Virgibacillus sp. MSP4-1]
MTNAFDPENKKAPIVCVGGGNVDKKLYITEKVMAQTSNPVKSSRNVGGVARNISENLGRLGEEVVFLSAAGDDPEWKYIDELSSPFMNVNYVTKFKNEPTGSYTAVLDNRGDLYIALADMDIFDSITPEMLLKNVDVLTEAKCIVVDMNCPGETIEFLCQFAAEHHIPLVIIPVSSPKMKRLPKDLTAVSWLIVNKHETETFLDMNIHSQEDWEHSVKRWLELGVQNVIVTNGSEGVVTGVKNGAIRYFPAVETPEVVDVTGAGDSFCSAVIYSWLQNKDFDEVVTSGLVNAHKTILSKYTVRPELSPENFNHDMEEFTNEKIY